MPDKTGTPPSISNHYTVVSSFSSERGRNESVIGKDKDTFVCGGEITLNGVCFSVKLEGRLFPQSVGV